MQGSSIVKSFDEFINKTREVFNAKKELNLDHLHTIPILNNTIINTNTNINLM